MNVKDSKRISSLMDDLLNPRANRHSRKAMRCHGDKFLWIDIARVSCEKGRRESRFPKVVAWRTECVSSAGHLRMGLGTKGQSSLSGRLSMGLSSAAGCCGGESLEEDELLRNLL